MPGQYTSPGAAAGQAIQEFMVQRALMDRQATLDALAAQKQQEDQRQERAQLEFQQRQLAEQTAYRQQQQSSLDDERQFRRAATVNATSVPGQRVSDTVASEQEQYGFPVNRMPGIRSRSLPMPTMPTGGEGPTMPVTEGQGPGVNELPGGERYLSARASEDARASLNAQQQQAIRERAKESNETRELIATIAAQGRSDRANTMTPAQRLTQTRLLRNEYGRETAAAREAQMQLALMQDGMKAARGGSGAAGAQAVLVTFQKILDPASVVRESEYARSSAGQAILARMEGLVERWAKGGAGVPVNELQNFVDLATSFAKNQSASAVRAKAQVDDIAGAFGLDPDLITRDVEIPTDDARPETRTPAASGTGTTRRRYDLDGNLITP